MGRYVRFRFLFVGLATALGVLAFFTWSELEEPPDLRALTVPQREDLRPLVLDRFGQPLRVSYAGQWNLHEQKALHEIPPLLREAVLFEEDRRYFEHSGVDWLARLSAVLGNIRKHAAVRGASTISEQVVRLAHARPRSLWAKWLEGWEARWLEQKNSKSEILEFYLNQVPYSQQRRGLAQAARLYFDRDLSTLNEKEILTLAVIIKSPARLDPRKNKNAAEDSVMRLATRMNQKDLLSDDQMQLIRETPLILATSGLGVEAPDFIDYLNRRLPSFGTKPIERTTLHPEWQRTAQRLLDEHIEQSKKFKIENGAILVLDHQTDEILVWAVAKGKERGTDFNAPLIPRQPGSSMKPFLYAQALEKGWTPASMIIDEPLGTAVGTGSHQFRNYSRVYYGPVTFREALANSLNIPAVKVLQSVGVGRFMETLRGLGIESLDQPADHYGDGLALGNGEVSLLEMTTAYAALARGGEWRAPRALVETELTAPPRQVFSPEAATLVSDILSDAHARRLEFGRGGTMEFPVQTAIKTGTSTDFRDAWVFAYNYRYVVGIWMGNLNYESTEGLTGSNGPVLIARALMAKMTASEETKPLRLSGELVKRTLCRVGDRIVAEDKRKGCQAFTEYFMPGTEGKFPSGTSVAKALRLVKPTEGLRMAVDPRVPASLQAYEFRVEDFKKNLPIRWYLNGQLLKATREGRLSWQLVKGKHDLEAVQGQGKQAMTSKRTFVVR